VSYRRLVRQRGPNLGVDDVHKARRRVGGAAACGGKGALLIATRRVLSRGVIWWATSRTTGTGTTRRRRAPCLIWAAMTAAVHVRVVVATRRWSGPGIVRIVRVARARWTILIRPSHATTRWGSSISSFTPIVKLARWRAAAVVVASGAVATRGAAAIIIVVVRGRWVATATATTAAHGRTRAVPITTAIIWCARASMGSPRLEGRRWGRVGDVRGAGDFLTLELTAVQLLDCGRQIGLCLVFDKAASGLAHRTDMPIVGVLTLCHRAHDQLRSRQRPIQTGGRNLSGPRNSVLSQVQSSKSGTGDTRQKAIAGPGNGVGLNWERGKSNARGI
jgi:hypothetical protein